MARIPAAEMNARLTAVEDGLLGEDSEHVTPVAIAARFGVTVRQGQRVLLRARQRIGARQAEHERAFGRARFARNRLDRGPNEGAST